MPVAVKTTVDPATLAGLTATLQRLQVEVSKSAEQAVGYAALKIAQSGRSASKLGKKKREIRVNPEWKQAKSSFAWARRQQRQGKAIPAGAQAALDELNSITPLQIVRHRQNKPTIYIGAYDRKDPRREIENRGLAKKVWNVMVGKLGSLAEGKGSHSGKDYRISKYQEQHGDRAGSTAVRLVNKLSYLEAAYPGITQTAIQNGTAALNGMLDRRIKRATERANRK